MLILLIANINLFKVILGFGDPNIHSSNCEMKRLPILLNVCPNYIYNITNCVYYNQQLISNDIPINQNELQITNRTSIAYIIGIGIVIIICTFVWTYQSTKTFKQKKIRKQLKNAQKIMSSGSLTSRSTNVIIPPLQLDMSNAIANNNNNSNNFNDNDSDKDSEIVDSIFAIPMEEIEQPHTQTNTNTKKEQNTTVLTQDKLRKHAMSLPSANHTATLKLANNKSLSAMSLEETEIYLNKFFNEKDVGLKYSEYLDIICVSIGDAFKGANNKRAMYLSLIPHILDTSTDIGVIIQFYYLSQTQSICKIKMLHLNANDLLILSVLSMTIYRIFTAFYLLLLSQYLSFYKKCIQFILSLLDLEIIRVIHINFKLNRNHPCNPQRLIHVLEACFESTPQAIIQTVYLWQTQQFFKLHTHSVFWFIFWFFLQALIIFCW